jgi:outer membrane protein OmpA-like peptidoglycan-associated protein
MTQVKTAFLATSALLLSATAALAVDQGGYVGLGAGIHMPRDSNLLIGTNARTMEFKNGPIVVGSAGYKWAQGFRTELELGYREGDVGNVVSPTAAIPWTGQQKTWSTMANAVYDFNTGTALKPYLGLGAGLSWLGWKNGFKGPTTATFDGTDKKFTWQGIAGVGYDATENLGLFLEYRYITLKNASFAANATPATPVISDHDDRSHNVLVGFRYTFGAAPVKAEPPKPTPPPAPAPAPRAATPPPPPPVPQNFIVFFDFDKSNLRSDAQKIVGDAAAYAKANKKTRIVTTGHADTSGTAAYNLALSERRAKAVKAELARLGIPESEVAVVFKGESSPMVATGDGVKEPQNRRVEIVLE